MRDARTKKKWSHEKAARHSRISRTFYTEIENGNRTPSLEKAFSISHALGKDIKVLFADVYQKAISRKEVS